MKYFAIMDMVSYTPLCVLNAQHGKSALWKFRKRLMNTGMYEIYKDEAGDWMMSSTYGTYFKAVEVLY